MRKNNDAINLIIDHLHKQFNLAQYYLICSNQISNLGMEYLANYVMELSNDKTGPHNERLINYLNSQSIDISKYPIKEFKTNIKTTLESIISEIYNIELNIRSEISNIVDVALKSSDYESFAFLQWFINDGLKDFNEIDTIKQIIDENKNLSNSQKDIMIKSALKK